MALTCLRRAVEAPTSDQRKDLPAEAYAAAWFDDGEGSYKSGGEFRSSKSKLPHHINTATDPNADGTVDLPRLRNALARFDQTDFSGFPSGTEDKARRHIDKHADKLLGDQEKLIELVRQDPRNFVEIRLLREALKEFRAGKKDTRQRIRFSVPIVKVDEEKRIIKGPVLRPEIRDRQKSIIGAEEIEQAAHSFLNRLNKGNEAGPATRSGLMHKEFDHDIDIVESYITDFDLTYSIDHRERKLAAIETGMAKQDDPDGDVDVELPAGTWMMAMKVTDDEVWKGVLNGTFKGFSMGGFANAVYEDNGEEP